jgi:hypothetical protein
MVVSKTAEEDKGEASPGVEERDGEMRMWDGDGGGRRRQRGDEKDEVRGT